MSFSTPPPPQNQFGGDFAPAPQPQYVERPGDSLQSGPHKSFLTTWLLAVFFGHLGVDRFYLGKIGTGIAKLVTFGGLGVWAIVDLILILAGKMTDKNGRSLEGYRQHKAKAIAITIVMWVISAILGVIFALIGVAAAQTVAANSAKSPGVDVSAPVVPEAQGAESPYSSGVAEDGKEIGNVSGKSFEVDTDGGKAKITIGKVAYLPKLDDTSTAKNGGFLIMEAQWETVSGKTTASPANFGAVSSDGTFGDMAFAPERELQTRELNAGECASGYLAFDIKRGDTTIEVYNDKLDKVATFSLAAANS